MAFEPEKTPRRKPAKTTTKKVIGAGRRLLKKSVEKKAEDKPKSDKTIRAQSKKETEKLAKKDTAPKGDKLTKKDKNLVIGAAGVLGGAGLTGGISKLTKGSGKKSTSTGSKTEGKTGSKTGAPRKKKSGSITITKSGTAKPRRLQGKFMPRVRPFGGRIAKLLLGKDEQFGGEAGLIDPDLGLGIRRKGKKTKVEITSPDGKKKVIIIG